jgi:hypothetical protein
VFILVFALWLLLRVRQPNAMSLSAAEDKTAEVVQVRSLTQAVTPPARRTTTRPPPSVTPTLMASATLTITDTPAPTATPCVYSGRFAEIWNSVQSKLGCPQGTEVNGGSGAAQVTTTGRVYWVGVTRRIYAFGANGGWSSVADLWVEGNPTYSCEAGRRAGFIRGFGRAWCDSSTIQSLLGSARGNEYAIAVSLMTFDSGLILRVDGMTRVAYNTGTWESR